MSSVRQSVLQSMIFALKRARKRLSSALSSPERVRSRWVGRIGSVPPSPRYPLSLPEGEGGSTTMKPARCAGLFFAPFPRPNKFGLVLAQKKKPLVEDEGLPCCCWGGRIFYHSTKSLILLLLASRLSREVTE